MSIRISKLLWGAAGTCIALFPAFLMAHYDGPDSGHTAAPVTDSPLACAASGCHTNSQQGGPINSFGGSVTATFSSGSTYAPGGGPITITIAATDPVNKHFGFQMTARVGSTVNSKTPQQAGTFNPGANPGTIGDPMIVLCSDNNLRPAKGCSAANPYEYIEHFFNSFTQVYTTSQTYSFTWTPPSTNVGAVNFYLAGNVVNFDGIQTGADHVYTSSYVLTPAQATPPSIVTGGVLNAASFAKNSNGLGSPVAPGSLVAIFASNFGTTQQTAQSAPLGFSSAGVSVMFGNTPAAIRDVIPAAGIVSAQVPFETTPGTVNVTMTANGATSAAMPTTIVAQAPGIFSIPPGAGYALLFDLTNNSFLLAAPASANIGLPSAAIPRGHLAFFYATGVGVMNPAVNDGDAPGGAHDGVHPVVTFGGVAGNVLYSGQAPGFPGVYQVNVQIPQNAPTGDAIDMRMMSADGTQISPAGVVHIAIQ